MLSVGSRQVETKAGSTLHYSALRRASNSRGLDFGSIRTPVQAQSTRTLSFTSISDLVWTLGVGIPKPLVVTVLRHLDLGTA